MTNISKILLVSILCTSAHLHAASIEKEDWTRGRGPVLLYCCVYLCCPIKEDEELAQAPAPLHSPARPAPALTKLASDCCTTCKRSCCTKKGLCCFLSLFCCADLCLNHLMKH
jgi:hypothetical protein